MFNIWTNLAYLLATLAIGYFVTTKANKETGFLRALGIVLGAMIIIISLLAVLFFTTMFLLRDQMPVRAPQSMGRMMLPGKTK